MKKRFDKKVEAIDSKVDKYRIKFKDDNARKVKEDVFDEYTLKTLYKLSKLNIIQAMGGIVSRGKEANVFLADGADQTEIAVKIYRITTSSFNSMEEYIVGDPRFKNVGQKKHEIVFAWTKKEYRNLKRAHEAGVRVPVPITSNRNVLIMEYLGKDGVPYPLLKDIRLTDTEAATICDKLIDYINKLYTDARLVHADLSEYNIMVEPNSREPIIIDMGQSTTLEHPRANEFLLRDIRNITKFFTRFGIENDPDKLYNFIKSP